MSVYNFCALLLCECTIDELFVLTTLTQVTIIVPI